MVREEIIDYCIIQFESDLFKHNYTKLLKENKAVRVS